METFRMLSSAPNWFQSGLCDSSSKGIVAIGTQHWITLLSVTPSTNNILNKNDHVFIGELLGHKDRVQCCKFSFFSSNILSPKNEDISPIELLVSGSADCSIRIWNVETKKCVIILKPEQKGISMNPITALTITKSAFNNLIISGDSKGLILCWNPITNNRIIKKISDTSIMSLEVCSYINNNNNDNDNDNMHQIAVGYKSGNVLLLNINENNINELCRFVGHDSEIQGLSWCHKYINIEIEKMENKDESKSEIDDKTLSIIDYLPNVFATISRDKFLKFWNTLTGQCLIEIEIGKYDKKQSSQQRIWYALLWLTPFKIYLSQINGKILCINLKNIAIHKGRINKDCLSKDALTIFGQGHSRSVFNIIPIKNRANNLLTISLDRSIIFWDINTQKPLWNMQCLGGYVYDLDFAPWNPSLLGIAVGDKMIRIWTVPDHKAIDNDEYTINPFYNLNYFENDTKKDRKSKFREKKRQKHIKNDPYHCKVIWRGLKDKITAIKWHPTDNGWLVYGTDKGSVGCININSNSSSNHCKLLTHHQGFITQVDWKIIAIKYRNDYNINDIKQKSRYIESGFRIYSLSKDGEILEGDGWKPNAPSININKYIFAANHNIKDILKTSSEDKILWTCFCIELMNPYHQQKYKQIIKTINNKDNNNIDIDNYSGQKMIIGSSKGLIYILNGDWKLLCSLNDYNSLITCIQINPFYNVTNNNNDNDNCKNLMAVGTVDGSILFYNIYNISNMENIESNMIYKIKHSVKSKAIVKIKWHPFISNIIVSISNDKQIPCYIWRININIKPKIKIEKLICIESEISKYPASTSWFTNCHHLKWKSIEWSHKDPFVLYSGSEDQTCRRINLKRILSNNKYNQLTFTSINTTIKSDANTIKICAKKDDIRKSLKNEQEINIKHQKLFQSFKNEKLEQQISKLWQLIKYYTFLLCNKDNKNRDFIIDFEKSDLLLLHTNDICKEDISKWISSILQKQESGLYPNQFLSSMCYQMQNLMQNDSKIIIKRELDKFNSKQSRNYSKSEKTPIPEIPSLLSLLMAPTLGRKEWIKSMLNLCQYYKHPLIGLYHNAAAIYLSLNLPQYVYQCIDMYCKIDYFYEALIIARYHLLPNHPIIKKILSLYAEKLLSKQKYIDAIKCYLAILSIYVDNKQEYIKHFTEIIHKYVFKLLIKHYFASNLQSEYRDFISNNNYYKRKMGNNDIYPLILMYDTINLLYNISSKQDKFKFQDCFKDETQNINDIFSMYWMIKLCVYSQCKDLKYCIDSEIFTSINKWTLKTNSEIFLWKSLFYFVEIMDVEQYQNKTISIELKSENNILETYFKLNFKFRVDHIYNCYVLPIQHNQTKRMHCVKFGNFLFHCYLYHISFEENIEKYISEFEAIIWESFNYAFTTNSLLLFHQYLGYILSFWKENELINSCDSYIVANLIFNTFENFNSNQHKNIDIDKLIMEYLKIIYRYESMNGLFKCSFIIKYFAFCLSTITMTESIKNTLDIQRDKKFWIIIEKVTQDSNINTIQLLIEKYNKMFKSCTKLKDPYIDILS